jgi:hypothetical protein
MSEVVEDAVLPPPTLTPLALVDKAIERGVKPDDLGKLIDLAETWRQSRAKEAFAVALSDVQANIPTVVKDADNTQTKSRYARLESVNRAVVPVFTSKGFSLSFSEDDDPKGREGWTRVVCDLTHRDGHSKTYHLDMPPEGEGIKGQRNMTQTHAKGSTLSYARRYLVCMIGNVTIADEDNDGNPDNDGNLPATPEHHARMEALMTRWQEMGGPEGKPGWKLNVPKWLAWLGAANIQSITRVQARRAIDDIERKIQQKGGQLP